MTFTLSISEPETGIWCDTCLLPSGVAFEVSALTTRGVTRPTRFAGCSDPACASRSDA